VASFKEFRNSFWPFSNASKMSFIENLLSENAVTAVDGMNTAGYVERFRLARNAA
jgi:hypothetical protein